MAEPNGRLWAKILLPLLPIIGAGFIGWGTLREQVRGTRDALDGKANRETVEAQYQAILRELQAIRQDISQFRRRP